jgi:hypothetical protein
MYGNIARGESALAALKSCHHLRFSRGGSVTTQTEETGYFHAALRAASIVRGINVATSRRFGDLHATMAAA